MTALPINAFRQLLRDSGFPNAKVLYARSDDGREVGDAKWDLQQPSSLSYDHKHAAPRVFSGAGVRRHG